MSKKYPKMNPDVKPLWVEKLKSGDYSQGDGKLRDANDNFCCLGVLCEVAVEQGIIKPAKLNDSQYRSYRYGEEGQTAFLPLKVAVWAGLENGTDYEDYEGSEGSLIHDNDSRKLSFSQIGDIIENHL